MKVLFINSVYRRGSTGRLIAELAQAVEKNAGEYKVAYGRGEKLKDENCYYIGGKLGVRIHAFLSRLTDKSGFYSRRATKKLIRFIRDYQPDIIHLHNLHGYYLNVEILFKYLKEEFKGKVVWTLHDCWAFTGHCVHYTYAKCDKWKNLCYKCVEKKEYPKSCFKDNSTKNYLRKKELFVGVENLTVVAVSDWLKEQAQQSFLGAYPIRRIYNGLDCNSFVPTESDFKEKYGLNDKKIILSISDGWSQRKGWGKLLQVIKNAPKDWTFVVVGLNKKQIKKLPINTIGFQRVWDKKELIEMYSSADVFFNPSVEETFGLVTAEAMACGTPVVVMNSTACPELVKEDSCGTVVEIDSTENFMQTIKLTLEKKKGFNNSHIKSFSKKFVEEYLELYSN